MHAQGVCLQRAQARRVARKCGGQVHLRMANGACVSHADVARRPRDPAYIAQKGAQQQQQPVHGVVVCGMHRLRDVPAPHTRGDDAYGCARHAAQGCTAGTTAAAACAENTSKRVLGSRRTSR